MANLRQIVLVVMVAAVIMVARASEHVVSLRLALEPDGHGLVADDIDIEDEMMMDTEANRRQLYRTRYISYEALKRNSIPCGRRGRSYYDCSRRRSANKWRRGCSRITYCARNSK